LFRQLDHFENLEKQRWAVDTVQQSFVPENVTWVHKLHWTMLMLLWNKLGRNLTDLRVFLHAAHLYSVSFLWQAKASMTMSTLPAMLSLYWNAKAERQRWVQLTPAETSRNPVFCHTAHLWVLYDKKNSDGVRNSMNPSVSIMNTISVLCEVGTEFMCVIYMNVGDNLTVPRARRLVSGISPTQTRFRSRAGPSEIYGGQSGTRTGFSPSTLIWVCRVWTLRGLLMLQRCLSFNSVACLTSQKPCKLSLTTVYQVHGWCRVIWDCDDKSWIGKRVNGLGHFLF